MINWLLAIWQFGYRRVQKNEVMFGIPNLVSWYLQLEGLEPLYYVRLSVTPAVSGVRGADEQQKTIVRPTYSVRLQ